MAGPLQTAQRSFIHKVDFRRGTTHEQTRQGQAQHKKTVPVHNRMDEWEIHLVIQRRKWNPIVVWKPGRCALSEAFAVSRERVAGQMMVWGYADAC